MSEEYVGGIRPFNSPFEVGMRSLFVLHAISPKQVDLQRLVFYDYLLVHSGDPGGGPPSAHAPVPHRSGEWMIRRELLRAGLDLMFSKELIEKSFASGGILYRASELTGPFLGYLQSEYAQAVRDSATWMATRFGNLSDADLTTYMVENLGRWGAEFYLSARSHETER